MFKFYVSTFVAFIFLTLFQGTCLGQGDPYITIWNTEYSGITNSSTIRIPASGEFTYTWEEVGNSSNSGSGSGTDVTDITFPYSGIYQVSMLPTGSNPFNRINFSLPSNFDVGGDREKLVDIIQWGDIHWTSMETAYNYCYNLTLTATDVPDLTGVTSLSTAFQNVSSLVGTSLSSWDVSNVTDMSYLFTACSYFNADLSNWDVSKVTDMTGTFYTALAFNQNLNNWDVSKVTNMFLMFTYAMQFNGDISNWDVSNVTNMDHMFNGAQAFNQNISGWNVSKVTNMDFLFAGAMVFNQNLGAWNLTSLTSAYTMFQISGLNCENYSQTLYGWANNANTPSNIDLNYSGPLRYGPVAVTSRNYLINTLGWNIISDTEDPDCMVVLPVKLVSFDVLKKENTAVLKWETASETNNSHFEIQVSQNAVNFQYLGLVEGRGTTDKRQTYSFVDNSPFQGIVYYRLKQTDLDGKFEYSTIKAVNFGNASRLVLYPNPAVNTVIVKGYQHAANILIYDSSGRLVMQKNDIAENMPITIGHLDSGLYNMKIIEAGGKTSVQRFVK